MSCNLRRGPVDASAASTEVRDSYPPPPCRASTSSRCTACRRPIRRTRRSSTTSRWPSSPARRSACSATTAPASRRCCGSWPGIDTEFRGEAQLAPGATVGLLEQEPQLDETKDVRGNVEDGVRRDARAARPLQRAGRRTTPTRPPTSSPRLQDADRRRRRLEPRHARSSTRWTRCACPPADADVTKLSGGERRRVALCRLLLRAPDLLLLDEPTNHLDAESVAWLERHLADYKGTVVAVTHDRYFLDNVAGWILELDRGRGIPYEGNYSSWLEQKQARLAQEEKTGEGAPAHDRRRARVGAPEPQGPPQEVQGAPQRLRGAARRGAQRQARPGPDPHPGRARASATSWSRPTSLRKGFGDRLLIEDLVVLAAAAAASSA